MDEKKVSGQLLQEELMVLDLDFVKFWLIWDGMCVLSQGTKIKLKRLSLN